MASNAMVLYGICFYNYCSVVLCLGGK